VLTCTFYDMFQKFTVIRKYKRSLRRGRLLGRMVFDSREETRYFSLLYLHRFSCSFNRLYCYAILYSTTLFCTIFYCTPLYYSVLYSTMLQHIVLFRTIPYNVLYCNTLLCMLHCLYCTLLYCTVIQVYYIILCCTMIYCTAPCCAVQFSTERLKQALDHSVPFSVKVRNAGNFTFC
jgi:hypothetical protein